MAKVTVLVEFDFDTKEYSNTWADSGNPVAVAQEIIEAALHGDTDLPEHRLADNGVTVCCEADGCTLPLGHKGECFG